MDAWSSEGFNVDSFRSSLEAEPNSASELLLKFDSLIVKNRLLRKRVIDSTMSRVEKSGWLSQLDEVENTESILKKWNDEAAVNRPWEPYIVKAEDRWSAQGRRSNLSALVKRLNSLDPSSFSACQPLLILFDDVSSESLISAMLDEIESDEARRRQVVNEMIELLSKEGVDASDARSMKINKALDHLSSLQSRADGARNNRLRIEREIRPYDDELANRLLEKNSKDMTEEVDAIVNNLSERLSSLTSTIDEWKHLGVKFPDGGKILPHDLLDWEAGLPEIEAAVEIHLRALERWKEFATLWPDRCGDSSLVGRLDKTEEFVDLVDSLDQEWRELELEGMQIIGSWEDKGFAMDIWRTRMAEEPRSATKWLKREEVNYQAANSLIEALMSLDASIDGEDEIIRRVAILREFDLDNDLIDEMNYFIETRARRGARHRSMLETDWMDLVRKGLAEDRPTASLTLAEFESLIADARTNKQHSGIPIERLEGRMVEEIEDWYQQGFSIEGLREMLEKDPVNLALRMTTMREAVANHEKLRRRVSSLDWTRAPRMSIDVNLDLSMPERLASLSARIPELMKALAQCKVEDPDFKFVAWRPRMRIKRVLVPAPESAEEDAMEAILKEMETDVSETEEENFREDEIVREDGLTDHEFWEDEKWSAERWRWWREKHGEKEEAVNTESSLDDVEPEASQQKTSKSINVDESVEIEHLHIIMKKLGLDEEYNQDADTAQQISEIRRSLAKSVGIEPRDIRVDRMLRLILRLLPQSNEHDNRRKLLIMKIASGLKRYQNWMKMRLEARHKAGKNNLILDSATLGKALERIPGPGFRVPLERDEKELPALNEMADLAVEVDKLISTMNLSSSSGVVVSAQ